MFSRHHSTKRTLIILGIFLILFLGLSIAIHFYNKSEESKLLKTLDVQENESSVCTTVTLTNSADTTKALYSYLQKEIDASLSGSEQNSCNQDIAQCGDARLQFAMVIDITEAIQDTIQKDYTHSTYFACVAFPKGE